MGTTTANIGIYIPDAGETNYDQSFAEGMNNIDAHDHSGGPNKGVPISGTGIADGSITKEKLATDVVSPLGGLAIDSLNPNALIADGILNSLYKVTGNGYLVKTGPTSTATREITTGTSSRLTITNPDGVAGNTNIDFINELPAVTPYPGAWLTDDGTNVAWYDPRDTFFFHEDFLGFALINASNDIINTAFMRGTFTGTNCVINSAGVPGSDNLGIISMNTGTTSSGLCALSSANGMLNFGGGRHILNMYVQVPTLSDGTNTYTLYMGFGNSSGAGEFTDGAYFVYSHGINSGNWRASTANSSTRTTLDSAVAVDTDYHLLTIDMNAAGNSVEFFVDGVSIGTITTNIPSSGNGIILKIEKSVGTTTRTLSTDYITYYHKLTNSRT